MPQTKNRGVLTPEISKKALELLGYEITTQELRLMPYLSYIMQNEQKIDTTRISKEENGIINKWYKAKRITGTLECVEITKEFWNIINELIFIAYVDLK